MSVLSAVAALTEQDIRFGKFWLRVRLCTLPETLGHLAAKVAAGAAEVGARPEDLPKPEPTTAALTREMISILPVAAKVITHVAVAGPDGQPVEWAPCVIVGSEAEVDHAAGKISAFTLDQVHPGCINMAVGVALHDLEAEAGTLRPFSVTMPTLSG